MNSKKLTQIRKVSTVYGLLVPLFLCSPSVRSEHNHEHVWNLGNVAVGSTVETEVEVCIDANTPFAYVRVGFGVPWDPNTQNNNLQTTFGPYSMGQLTSWSGSTLLVSSKCRKSSVFFTPIEEGTFTAQVVGQVTSGGNDGYYRNDIHHFTANAVGAPFLEPIKKLLLSD